MGVLNSSIRINTGFKKVLLYILSFVIPFIVMVLAIIALRITPFGDHSLAISDGKFYINGEMFFKRLLMGDENILYSFNNGIGGNEWSIFAWGGFSLGGLLSVIGTLDTMPSVFTWICTVNMAVCGLTMYILLAYIKGHRISNLIFSTTYALTGYNVVNCLQALFFIGPQMLPLVILGLIMILRDKKPLVYIFSLAVCIFFNFYFGFQLCVISVIVFITYMIINRQEWRGNMRRKAAIWTASSLIAGLLAAPMWLPTMKAYSGGGRLNQTGITEYSFNENMPFIQIFSKLFTGANSTDQLILGLPNIFCGILVVALVILYFMNKGVDARRKRAAGIILAIYLVSFYIPAFTLLMHGGTHTNWFPYRYSYVFCFLLICIAAEEFCYLDEITMADTKKCGTGLLIGTILVFSTKYEYITGGSVLLDLALLMLMWVGFWFYKTRPDKAPMRTFSMLLLLIVCGNLYANYIISISNMREWELDLKKYRENTLVYGAMIEAVNAAEDSFFRMEKDFSESGSVGADPLKYNYNGVSHSGPAVRDFIHKGLCKLGINWFDMRHWYSEGITAATDTLLGLKYLISENDQTVEKGYEYKLELDNKKLYYNESALSVPILVNKEAGNITLGDDIFTNLNTVWKSMTGEKREIFTKQDNVNLAPHNAIASEPVNSEDLKDFKSKEESESSLTSGADNSGSEVNESSDSEEDGSKSTYIEYSFTAVKDGPVYVFDTSIPGSDKGQASPGIKYCGTYHKGDKVTGRFDVKDADYIMEDTLKEFGANLSFAVADNDVLEEYAMILNKRDISFDVVHENDLTGEFTADKDQRILFTIPWDEGWTCYIDGKEVPIEKTWDLFMSVEATEGKHTYEMKFVPAWMDYGLYLCGAAFIGLIALMVVLKKKKDDPDKETDDSEAELIEDIIEAEAEIESEEIDKSEQLIDPL